ncbi:MAG: glucose-6-phosphate dehydrogenase [Alkalibacterium sp.]|nr:glucose-6-phosphate dehydrogenase [Alkalibacterium sp.]
MSHETKALFIIFGATGDLAHRKLYPAIYELYKKGYLSKSFAVIGTARREWSDDYFQEVVRDSIADGIESEEHAKEFSTHFRYQSHNVKDTAHYVTLKKLADELDEEYGLEGNRIFYLSMSPSFFGTITSHLKAQSLATDEGFNRVVIEKPFGTDFESSKELNDEINSSFAEDQLYRIDHYLGKEMVQNILALRFSNPLLENSWNKETIANFQVTLSEDLGVEERGEYYDKSGALRDMVQNHVLQVVGMLTMNRPDSFTPEDVRREKLAIIESLKTPVVTQDETTDFVRGQYSDSSDQKVKAYRNEDKVDPESLTETFVAGQITIDTDEWRDVPVYVRTGKRMAEKLSRIDIVFKETTSDLFNDSPSTLTIFINPDQGVELVINNKKIGPGMDLEPMKLASLRSKETLKNSPEAYEKLILDVLNGDETHFAHWGEVAESWKYVDQIRQTWDSFEDHIPFYPALSVGPAEANQLLERNGHHWVYTAE